MPKITGRISKLKEALRLHSLGLWCVPQWGRASVLDWQTYRLSEDDLRHYLSDDKANIAIALHQSPFIDVECDSQDAEDRFQELLDSEVPATPTWKSRRGLHRLFLRPEGLTIHRTTITLDGIEFRGLTDAGALSTVPPSQHPEDGTVYRWLEGLSLGVVGPQPLPEPLLKLLQNAPKQRGKIATTPDGKIPEGMRDDELYRYGCRIVAKEGIENVADLLHGKNKRLCDPPLPDAQVDKIIASVAEIAHRSKTDIVPVACNDWRKVLEAWRAALEMRKDIEDVLAISMAVCASTSQTGDQQLFLQMVGAAGSAKTRICDAMLVSSKCFLLEHLTGFHSGWKDGTGKDFSLIARINHCTLITPEGDVIMSSPRFAEIMSQQRRIFDGSSSATYKNSDEDMRHTGLRTPWIMAGTPAMLNSRQAHLGDRFLKVVIDEPTETQRQRIIRKSGLSSWDAVNVESNCTPDSILTPELRLAYQTTGGYIDWLRANVTAKLRTLSEHNRDKIIDHCASLADFTAHMRSHPPEKKSNFEPEYEATKELPSRLEYQFVRLAKCLAVVLGKQEVDDEIMGMVRRVAMDTSRGMVYSLTKQLAKAGLQGSSVSFLAVKMSQTDERISRWLAHMRRVGVADWREDSGATRWLLTPKVLKLYEQIHGETVNA